MIHAYSLIHDDLPAMDNDDLRRGMPTCHKIFREGLAILAGDALQALAFQVLTQENTISVAKRLQMIGLLAQTYGSLGMAGGQALDRD
jgi:geranylgeranyl diphosphate synthase, type II